MLLDNVELQHGYAEETAVWTSSFVDNRKIGGLGLLFSLLSVGGRSKDRKSFVVHRVK